MTEVLIAGGGTVGLSAALLLSHQGIDVMVVEQQDGPSIHPRATGVGTRTVEIFRQVGIDKAVDAAAIDMSAGSIGKLTAETLATADFGKAPPPRKSVNPFREVSPASLRGTCPQDRLDAVLLAETVKRGGEVRYSTRLESFEQDSAGVTAKLDTGETVRADYLIGADGVRSGVREALGIGTSGPGNLGERRMNILFRADLTPYLTGAPFVTCTIENPEVTGLLVTIDGSKNWVLHVAADDEEFTAERCQRLIRAAIGDSELDVEVLSVLPWRVRALLADSFTKGRVFLVGDAAHTIPPIGGFGMNTGIADAHNLAWKLAMVLKGQAGQALLDTYNTERHPVAAMTYDQAARRAKDVSLHWGNDEAARIAAGVINAPVVHLGYRYDSAAIIDPQPDIPSTQDVTLVFDGAPGSRVPHAWLADGSSTVDLAEFTLLTRSEAWLKASQLARRVDDLPGLTDEGALLVRPDGYIAWRATTLQPVDGVLDQILARTP